MLDGASRAVFQGKIIVEPGAQQTDAKMVSNALLLSDEAEADNKPELEIFADDVQCGHGATVTDIDANHLYYMMARGTLRFAAGDARVWRTDRMGTVTARCGAAGWHLATAGVYLR